MDEHFVDLERRLNILEKSVATLKTDLPPAVEELKEAVEQFKKKLRESQSYSSWIDNNNMGLPGRQEALVIMHPYWRHVKYRRKVPDEVDEVVSRYKQMKTSEVSEDAIRVLRLPAFNTWMWEDAELLLMLEFMYEDLQLMERFSIDLSSLRSFLSNSYHHYNQVPFHNFRHAFSVAQMMYGMICKCNLQSRLSDIDILILLSSCVCHDLDHPGFNNIYQINAKTELALRYNDISPLENHHCAVAFQVLEKNECNIFRNLTPEEYRRVREGMIRCILATDMARHNEILQEFRDATPVFSFDNKAHTNLLFMILIKVADISNEARPLDIAEPWLECLMQEFFNQSDLEKLEGLPVSPFMDREKVTKPSSQVSFIGFVLLPLFEALGEVLPELDALMIQPVKEALEHYRRLSEIAKKLSEEQEDITEEDEQELEDDKELSDDTPNEERSNASSHNNLKKILSKTESFTSLRSRTSSRGLVRATSSRDTDPDLDSTETEVDVSERISKFKISTETSRRNSYDRKGSIDRRFSVERTVSPRMLEERLRTHTEAEGESPTIEELPEGIKKSENFLSRMRNLSGRLTSEKSEDETSTSSSVLKQEAQKTTKNDLKSDTFADRMRISFATTSGAERTLDRDEKLPVSLDSVNETLVNTHQTFTADNCKIESQQLISKKIPFAKACCESPTLSEKSASSPNSFLRHKKKFSLSLDVLPKRNGKQKKNQSCTESQRVSSDEALNYKTSFRNTDSRLSSPKSLKKKHESAAAILLRSISFRKKSAKEGHSSSVESKLKLDL